MAQDRKRVNPELVSKAAGKRRVGGCGLSKKTGPPPASDETDAGAIWDEDRCQLAENQDMSEIEKVVEKGRST